MRAIVSPNGDYGNGIVLTEDLRRPGGYLGERLPEGVTLDDVGGLSIWCVPFGANFGDVSSERSRVERVDDVVEELPQ